jgi:hypothetical protein
MCSSPHQLVLVYPRACLLRPLSKPGRYGPGQAYVFDLALVELHAGSSRQIVHAMHVVHVHRGSCRQRKQGGTYVHVFFLRLQDAGVSATPGPEKKRSRWDETPANASAAGGFGATPAAGAGLPFGATPAFTPGMVAGEGTTLLDCCCCGYSSVSELHASAGPPILVCMLASCSPCHKTAAWQGRTGATLAAAACRQANMLHCGMLFTAKSGRMPHLQRCCQ